MFWGPLARDYHRTATDPIPVTRYLLSAIGYWLLAIGYLL
jgi:hypothetical protein